MKLGITYCVKKKIETGKFETDESYIELPAMEDLEPLAYGEKSGIGYAVVRRIISDIALIQGYSFMYIDKIEIVK